MYNGGETGFQVKRDHKHVKAVVSKGSKAVLQTVNGRKESIACFTWSSTVKFISPIFVLNADNHKESDVDIELVTSHSP